MDDPFDRTSKLRDLTTGSLKSRRHSCVDADSKAIRGIAPKPLSVSSLREHRMHIVESGLKKEIYANVGRDDPD